MQSPTFACSEAEPERHARLRKRARRYIVATGLGLAAFSVAAPWSVHATNINSQTCSSVSGSKDSAPASGQGSFVFAFTVPYGEVPYYIEMAMPAVATSNNSKQEKQATATCTFSNVVVQKNDGKGR